MRQCFSVLKHLLPNFQANPERLELTEHFSFRFVNLLFKNTNTDKRNAENILEATDVGDLLMNTDETSLLVGTRPQYTGTRT
jgi:hypothetical protein